MVDAVAADFRRARKNGGVGVVAVAFIFRETVSVVIHVGIGEANRVRAVAVLIHSVAANVLGAREDGIIGVVAVAFFLGEAVVVGVVKVIQILQGDSQMELSHGDRHQAAGSRDGQRRQGGDRLDHRVVGFEFHDRHGKIDRKRHRRPTDFFGDQDSVFRIAVVVDRLEKPGDVGHFIVGFVLRAFHQVHRGHHRPGNGLANNNAPDEKLDGLAFHVPEAAAGVRYAGLGFGSVFQPLHQAVGEHAFLDHRFD